MNSLVPAAALTGIFLFSSHAQSASVSREDTVAGASLFASVQVTLSTTNLLSPTTSVLSLTAPCDYRFPGIVCAGPFVGESYVWGGFATAGNWQTNISVGGKKAVANSQLGDDLKGFISDLKGVKYFSQDFSGIDCSGMVSRAWAVSRKTTSGLRALTLPVPWSQLKRGDVFIRDADMGDNTHVALVSQNVTGASVSLIHAASKGYARGSPMWRAISENVLLSCVDDYNCYLGTGIRLMAAVSAFPQFSSFIPASDAVVSSSRPTVSASIQSGTSLSTASVILKIDGTTIAGASVTGSGSQLSVSSALANALSDGIHTIVVIATNSINLGDQGISRFTVDTESPGGSVTDGEGGGFPGGVIQGDRCAVFRSSDSASGICSMSLSGPPGFTSASITLPQPASLVAWAAPFCQLSSGTYTLLVTDCAGKTGSYNFQAATKTLALTLTANGPLGWSDSSSVGVSVDQIQSTNWGFRVETQRCATELIESCKGVRTSVGGATSECSYWEGCGFLSKVMSTATFSPPWQSSGYSISNATTNTTAAPIAISAGSTAGGGASVTTSTPLAPGESISGYISVPQTPKSIWRSTITTEIEVLAPVGDIRISSIPIPPDMAAAAQHNLQRQSSPGVYDLSVNSATGVFGTTVTISILYLDSVNTDTTTVRLFRWDGMRWSSAGLTNQSVAKSSSGIITIIARSTGTSWYAAFFQATDASAPVTTWSIQGSSYEYAGITVVSTYSYLVLSATDPVVSGFNSGLATTYYRIDGLAGDQYTAYSSSIPAPFGTHWVDYYSTDFASNIESVKRITFTVTAGDFTLITEGDLTFDTNLLVGLYGSGAKTEIVARAEYDYSLRISSADGRSMLAVDNVGLVSIGTAPAAGRLTLAGVSQDTALALRSGNSTASVAGAQLAFGYDGSGDLRHRIYTQHGSAANFNRFVFALWTPASGSSSTLGALPVLSLEGSTITAANALVHVMPAGIADKELVVSNGSAMGEGDVLRWERWVPSATILKKDIERLGKVDEEKAWEDIGALRPVAFRRKSGGPDAQIERGYIYEETPSSIRDGPGATSVDERLVNAELALKAAMRRIAALRARIKKLKEVGR